MANGQVLCMVALIDIPDILGCSILTVGIFKILLEVFRLLFGIAGRCLFGKVFWEGGDRRGQSDIPSRTFNAFPYRHSMQFGLF